jgi:alpha-tubulin suppressor-like RCC1 family protein
VAVDLGVPIVGLGTGYESTYVLSGYGSAIAWGSNARKQLGTNEGRDWSSEPKNVLWYDATGKPVILPKVAEVVRSSGAGECVKMMDFTLAARYFCWGSDDHGELGFGSVGNQQTIAKATSVLPSAAANMARGDAHACVTADEGNGTQILCFGLSGRVGNGTTDPVANQTQPMPVKWNPENAQGFLTR